MLLTVVVAAALHSDIFLCVHLFQIDRNFLQSISLMNWMLLNVKL
jgi:hypothetical protein